MKSGKLLKQNKHVTSVSAIIAKYKMLFFLALQFLLVTKSFFVKANFGHEYFLGQGLAKYM